MRILSINTKYNHSKKTNFKAHPDFKNLAKDYDIVASSFFRRGPLYGAPSENFIDIIKLFKEIFKKNSKQKMLIAGIGESQEPFSYLATIKSLFKDSNLTDILELKTVDLQSRPTRKQLFKHSYFEYPYEPDYARTSFIKDVRSDMRYKNSNSYYRVNDEIFDFLNNAYKQNSLWDMRLQEAVKTFADEEFDIISINNTIAYITDKDSRINTINDIYRTLKKNGTFITDPYYNFIKEANLSERFFKIADGIYKKK